MTLYSKCWEVRTAVNDVRVKLNLQILNREDKQDLLPVLCCEVSDVTKAGLCPRKSFPPSMLKKTTKENRFC